MNMKRFEEIKEVNGYDQPHRYHQIREMLQELIQAVETSNYCCIESEEPKRFISVPIEGEFGFRPV